LNKLHNIQYIGIVKIIQDNCVDFKTQLPFKFKTLEKNEFFSRGELDYYTNINSNSDLIPFKKDILVALQDVYFNKYTKEYIEKLSSILSIQYNRSLFRVDNYQINVSLEYSKLAIEMLNEIENFLSTYKENKSFILNLLYGSVVTTLEAYLGDAFKYNVLNNQLYFDKFIQFYNPNNAQKYELRELLRFKDSFSEFINDEIKSDLNKIIFHDLEKVNSLYKKILNVDLSKKLFEFISVIANRHDIFHRNGKDFDNNPLKIDSYDILDLIKNVKAFVIDTEKNLKACIDN